MLSLTDAQTWTLIVGVLTTFGAMVGLVAAVFLRALRAEIGGLRGEMVTRPDYLDRDVQALMKHVFHRPE